MRLRHLCSRVSLLSFEGRSDILWPVAAKPDRMGSDQIEHSYGNTLVGLWRSWERA